MTASPPKLNIGVVRRGVMGQRHALKLHRVPKAHLYASAPLLLTNSNGQKEPRARRHQNILGCLRNDQYTWSAAVIVASLTERMLSIPLLLLSVEFMFCARNR